MRAAGLHTGVADGLTCVDAVQFAELRLAALLEFSRLMSTPGLRSRTSSSCHSARVRWTLPRTSRGDGSRSVRSAKWHRRVAGEIQRDVDDHVLLAADQAAPADLDQDGRARRRRSVAAAVSACRRKLE